MAASAMTLLYLLAALGSAFFILFALWLLVWSFTMSQVGSQVLEPQRARDDLPLPNHSQDTR